jgi:hypothetical protein
MNALQRLAPLSPTSPAGRFERAHRLDDCLFVCQQFNIAGGTPARLAYAPRVRITTDQAEKLREQINRHLRYFRRLRIRLEQLRYLPTDPLYLAALKAEHAAQDLAVAAHYDSCTSGVGRSYNPPIGRPDQLPGSTISGAVAFTYPSPRPDRPDG